MTETTTPRSPHVLAGSLLALSTALAGGCGGSDSAPPPPANSAPVIGGAPQTAVDEFQTYAFTPTASDPDGDALGFSVQNLPVWASFDEASGTLTGTPGEADDGVFGPVVISVSDGSLTSSLTSFSITVNEVNTAPTLQGAPVTSVDEGTPYTFVPTASDADPADALTFTIVNRPPWAIFDPTTGTIAGTPADGDAGLYADIVVSVSDGIASTALPAFDLRVVEITSLTLAGRVTDEPIANAAVEVTAGAVEGAATADADGNFLVPLTLREGDYAGDTLVEIRARGTGAQDRVELISVPGTIDELVRAAGQDGILDARESARVNVTHLTTSRYLLAADYNGGLPPADAASLLRAEAAVPADDLLFVAGLVKAIVDGGLLAVPDGETTFSLLRPATPDSTSLDTIQTLLAEAGLIDAQGAATAPLETSLAAARAATLDDPDVLVPPAAADLAGVSVWAPAAPPDILPRSAADKSVIEFAEDGTGTLFQPAFTPTGLLGTTLEITPLPFTWTITGSELALTFDANIARTARELDAGDTFDALVTDYGFDQEVADFLAQAAASGASIPSPLTVDERLAERTVRFVSRSETVRHAVTAEVIEYSLDDTLVALDWPADTLPRGRVQREDTRIADTGRTDVGNLTDEILSRQTWAIPTFYALVGENVGLAQDLFTLLPNGTTTPGVLSGNVYQWGFEGEALELVRDTERYTYRRWRTPVRGVEFVLGTYEVDGTVRARFTDLMARQLASEAGALAGDLTAVVLPQYWSSLAGTGADRSDAYLTDGRLDPARVFGWLFREDLTATRFVGENDTCLLDDSRGCFDADNSDWLWTATDARISLSREISPDGDTRERDWQVLRYDAATGSALVLELELLRIAGPGVRELLVPPRLDRLDVADLSVYPEEYQDALDRGFPLN